MAALVIDAADQTIFQNNTDLDLDELPGVRQGARRLLPDDRLPLDVPELGGSVRVRGRPVPLVLPADRGAAVRADRSRALLIIFPNTFEYFFIAYEVVRLWWNPARLSQRRSSAAAAIWIFIKLPQEWWIHIAQLDFTDFMKEDVFGVTVDTSWGDAIAENLWFVGLLVVVVVGVVVAIQRLRPKLPPPDWSFTMDIDDTLDQGRLEAPRDPSWQPIISWYMFEKVALVAMVSTIFALVVPDNEVSFLGVVGPVAFIIIVNSFVSTWLAGRGRTWESTGVEFLVMAAINLGSALVFILLVRSSDSTTNEAAVLFFVLLLTLIVTLFDRFHRSVPSIIKTAPRAG